MDEEAVGMGPKTRGNVKGDDLNEEVERGMGDDDLGEGVVEGLYVVGLKLKADLNGVKLMAEDEEDPDPGSCSGLLQHK